MNDIKNELIYREGSLADAEQLKNLGLLAYGQYADVLNAESWARMHQHLNNDEHVIDLIKKSKCFVCVHQNKIIGMAYFIPNGNPDKIYKSEWCCIRMVGVNPDYRGYGIAKTLTKMCINYAISKNEKTMALHTSEIMPAARHIYENLGFTILHEIETPYNKRYWLYTLNLSAYQAY